MSGLIQTADFEALDQQQRQRVESGLQAAEAGPFPALEEVLTDVFADDTAGKR